MAVGMLAGLGVDCTHYKEEKRQKWIERECRPNRRAAITGNL